MVSKRKCLVIVIIQITAIWIIWNLQTMKRQQLNDTSLLQNQCKDGHIQDVSAYASIKCRINKKYSIDCVRNETETFVPFKFIKKYFDIYGDVVRNNGTELLEWSHSYSTVFTPKETYNPNGVFMHFQNFKVEERERVKCISATEGVPISTQWNPSGYYYPTQIAQFGLSHYSKNLTEPPPIRLVVEDGEHVIAPWITSGAAFIQRIEAFGTNTRVLHFKTIRGGTVTHQKTYAKTLIAKVDLKFSPDPTSAFIISVKNTSLNKTWNIHYTCSDKPIFIKGVAIHYGLDCRDREKWIKLTRDVAIDLQKGMAILRKLRMKLSRSTLEITGITLRGRGMMDNLTLSSSEHVSQFYDSARWFVNNQNGLTGGWPVPVSRKVAGLLKLDTGWLSAMSQGQAISVLSRAYYHSKDEVYLQAALKAIRPFSVLNRAGGVLALYLNQVPWYEEYPTQPGTFVLNGFIYSLIGLYDLMNIAPQGSAEEVRTLYKDGVESLKLLLLSFDTGSGTSYDLRHHTLGIAPKLARWDYHATHVGQLLLLTTIDKSPIFDMTAKRWMGYMYGKRASHN